MNNKYLMERQRRDGRNPYGSRGGYVTQRRRGRDRAMDGRDYYSERDSRHDYRRGSYDRGPDYHMGSQHNREYPRPAQYEMRGMAEVMPRHDYGDYRDYRDYNDYGDYNDYRRTSQGRYTYRGYRDYGEDYGDYGEDYGDYGEDYATGDVSEETYHKELKKFIEKNKEKDRFKLEKEHIIKSAKQMGVNFEEFDEDEFVAVYYMLVADYPNSFPQYQSYIDMARQWMESKTSKRKNSDKFCAYLHEIVLAK